MLCPRFPMSIGFRPVSAVPCPHRPGRQPGRLRPALPVALSSDRGKAAGAVFSSGGDAGRQLYSGCQRPVYDRACGGAGAGRGDFAEDRRAGQGGILCGGNGQRLPHGGGRLRRLRLFSGISPSGMGEGETEKVSHRPYGTGFYFGIPGQNVRAGGYVRPYEVAAVSEEWRDGRLRVSQRNRFFRGDVLEILVPGKKPLSLPVSSLWSENRRGTGNR